LDNHGKDWIYIGDLQSEDAREVLRIQAKRAIEGEKKYGPLDVMSGSRQWPLESLEERYDANFYDTCEMLRRWRLQQASESRR